MTARARRRCSRGSTASASASTPSSSTRAWCIARARCSTKPISPATRTPSSISSIRRSPRITWWFDHHQSAFLTPEDASHFEQEQSNTKFYDPDFRSCTKFIATVTEQRFGFNPAPVAELIEWADIIDGALYDDAAVRGGDESAGDAAHHGDRVNQDPQFIPQLIPMLAYQAAGRDRRGAVRSPSLLPPLMERHRRSIEILRERAKCKDGIDLLRRHRSRTRGLQQIHPVLSASGLRLQRGTEQEQLPHQGVGRIQSVDDGDAAWRTWRRFASAMAEADTPAWGDLVSSEHVRRGTAGRGRDCEGVARQLPRARREVGDCGRAKKHIPRGLRRLCRRSAAQVNITLDRGLAPPSNFRYGRGHTLQIRPGTYFTPGSVHEGM